MSSIDGTIWILYFLSVIVLMALIVRAGRDPLLSAASIVVPAWNIVNFACTLKVSVTFMHRVS